MNRYNEIILGIFLIALALACLFGTLWVVGVPVFQSFRVVAFCAMYVGIIVFAVLGIGYLSR